MTQEEILKNNILIAEFMEYDRKEISCTDCKFYDECNHLQCSLPDKELYIPLQYNSSWNWLFPVLERIEALGYRWEIGMSSEYQGNRFHYCKIWSIGKIEGISPLDAVYGAVVTFIIWFNNNRL